VHEAKASQPKNKICGACINLKGVTNIKRSPYMGLQNKKEGVHERWAQMWHVEPKQPKP